jgi:hypothetical protein
VPFFRDSAPNEIRRQEYERYHCGQAFFSVVKGNIPDVCKKYHYSIGFYVHGGAFCKYYWTLMQVVMITVLFQYLVLDCVGSG